MNEQTQSREDVMGRRMKQVFVLFAVIGGFFIVAEHRAHLIPYLPWLFLAACPLMHVFMHHGHGRHQHHAAEMSPIGNAMLHRVAATALNRVRDKASLTTPPNISTETDHE